MGIEAKTTKSTTYRTQSNQRGKESSANTTYSDGRGDKWTRDESRYYIQSRKFSASNRWKHGRKLTGRQ